MKHTFRSGHNETKTKDIGRAEAIKWFCYECMGFNRAEIARCTAPTCPLFCYRGKPPLELDISDEKRAELRERMAAIRSRNAEG